MSRNALLSDQGLTFRLWIILKNELGHNATVADLAEVPMGRLLRLPGFGKKCRAEVEALLLRTLDSIPLKVPMRELTRAEVDALQVFTILAPEVAGLQDRDPIERGYQRQLIGLTVAHVRALAGLCERLGVADERDD